MGRRKIWALILTHTRTHISNEVEGRRSGKKAVFPKPIPTRLSLCHRLHAHRTSLFFLQGPSGVRLTHTHSHTSFLSPVYLTLLCLFCTWPPPSLVGLKRRAQKKIMRLKREGKNEREDEEPPAMVFFSVCVCGGGVCIVVGWLVCFANGRKKVTKKEKQQSTKNPSPPKGRRGVW